MSHLLNFRYCPRCQRARQYHDASTRHTQGSSPGVCCSSKSAGYDTYRGHPLGLCHHCGVETPRRAGPSIRDGMYDHVAIFG